MGAFFREKNTYSGTAILQRPISAFWAQETLGQSGKIENREDPANSSNTKNHTSNLSLGHHLQQKPERHLPRTHGNRPSR
jgi:hypothetical protein